MENKTKQAVLDINEQKYISHYKCLSYMTAREEVDAENVADVVILQDLYLSAFLQTSPGAHHGDPRSR